MVSRVCRVWRGHYTDSRSWRLKIRRRPFRSHSERRIWWVSICLWLWALDCRIKQVISHNVENSLNSPHSVISRRLHRPPIALPLALSLNTSCFLGAKSPLCISTAKRLCASAHIAELWLEAHSWLEVDFTVPCRKVQDDRNTRNLGH